MLKAIVFMFNFFPIFHISRDKDFGSITQINDLRFSLIHLPYGDGIIYFITYNKNSKFNIFYIIKLSNIQESRDASSLTEGFKKFEYYSSDRSSKLRMEFLQHKYSDCLNSINSLNNKVNLYIAIVLVYTGFVGYLSKESFSQDINNINCFLLTAIILCIFNLYGLCSVLKRYLDVKSYSKSSFGDLKAQATQKNLTAGIYYDWIGLSDKIIMSGSLVRNIEKYFYRSAFFSICSIILLNLSSQPLKITDTSGTTVNHNEYIIVDENGNFSTKTLFRLSENMKDKEVIFIFSESNNSAKRKIDFIVEVLDLDNKNHKIKLNRNLLDNRTIIANINEETK